LQAWGDDRRGAGRFQWVPLTISALPGYTFPPIAAAAGSGHDQGMGIERIRERAERRRALGAARPPEPSTRSEAALYDRCLGVAEAAQELERVAGAEGAAGAVPPALGCATSAFESLANSMLMMRGVVLREQERAGGSSPDAERLARLLFAIDQNLRFAAHAADLGRRGPGAEPEVGPALRSLAG
jgi:hypothetical protein